MKSLLLVLVVAIACVVPVWAETETAVFSGGAESEAPPSNFETMAVAVGPDLPMAFGLDGDVVTVSFWIHDRESATFKNGIKMYLAGPFDWPFGDNIEAKLAKMPSAVVKDRVVQFSVTDSEGKPFLKDTKFVAFAMIDGVAEYLDVLDPVSETPALTPYTVEFGKPGVAYKANFASIQSNLKKP